MRKLVAIIVILFFAMSLTSAFAANTAKKSLFQQASDSIVGLKLSETTTPTPNTAGKPVFQQASDSFARMKKIGKKSGSTSEVVASVFQQASDSLSGIKLTESATSPAKKTAKKVDPASLKASDNSFFQQASKNLSEMKVNFSEKSATSIFQDTSSSIQAGCPEVKTDNLRGNKAELKKRRVGKNIIFM